MPFYLRPGDVTTLHREHSLLLCRIEGLWLQIDVVVFHAGTEHDTERNMYYPVVNIRQHGVDKAHVLNFDFITSRDYKRIAATGVNIANLLEEGAYVQRGEKTRPQ